MHCSLKRNSKRSFNNILIEIIHIHAVKTAPFKSPWFQVYRKPFFKDSLHQGNDENK